MCVLLYVCFIVWLYGVCSYFGFRPPGVFSLNSFKRVWKNETIDENFFDSSKNLRDFFVEKWMV